MTEKPAIGFTPAAIVEEEDAEVSLYEAIAFKNLKFSVVDFDQIENKLPVGLFIDGEVLKDVVLKPYTTEHDRVLGQALKQQRNKLIPVLKAFIPKVTESIGGYTFDDIAKKTSTSPNRFVENMYLGDVLTILMMVRSQAQGNDIAITATCPNCGTKNEDNPEKGRDYHDLSSMQVKTIPNLTKKPVVEVTLKDGFMAYGDKVTKLLLEPLKLYQAEVIAKAENGAPEDIATLYAMVKAIPEAEAFKNVKGQIFSDELYDSLSIFDVNLLRDVMGELQPGPKTIIELDCYQCGNEWEHLISWGRLREFLFVPPKPRK